ncbi:MAG: Ig-like domain-containing protein [Fidelibacterota bacterium]
MKRKLSILLGIIALLWLATGCNNNNGDAPEIVSISPPDGATEVARTTAVEVTFSDPMDTGSCESRFGIFAGQLSTIPESMMGRMAGQFSWNGERTVMTFHPDTLMDSTQYSVCLQSGMMMDSDHGEGMMMSGMQDHGMEVEEGIISFFTTAARTSPRILSVTPAAGSTGINPMTTVEIRFSVPINHNSVESRIELHQGELTEMPMMGMMSGLDGSYTWNETDMTMVFDPDSMLMDSTMYTLCLMDGMETMQDGHQTMMSEMISMGDQVNGGVFIAFVTE